MFSRLLAATPVVAGRRSYSFFSSKPPGGLVKPSQSQTNVVKHTTTPSTTPSPSPSPSTSTSASSSASPAPATQTKTQAASPSPTAEPKSLPAPPAPTPIPTLHPAPILATMHLHSFFSLDRPMLLLSQPTSRLFDTAPPSRALAEDAGETDADADAARALSHALVMSRVQSAADWAGAMQRLGMRVDAADVKEEAKVQDDLEVLMDSVKRKRRKKITKHKYKKRRKLQRSERRRLGK